MKFLRNPVVRRLMAAVCAVGHLAALPQLSGAVLWVAGHGGHQALLVAHEGHHDLMLHHDDEDEGELKDEGSHAAVHGGHRDHHDHVVCLAAGPDGAALPDVIRVAGVPCAPGYAQISAHEPRRWEGRDSSLVRWARPPPPGVGGVLVGLRTTVLLV